MLKFVKKKTNNATNNVLLLAVNFAVQNGDSRMTAWYDLWLNNIGQCEMT